jgi:hypothetical protein
VYIYNKETKMSEYEVQLHLDGKRNTISQIMVTELSYMQKKYV